MLNVQKPFAKIALFVLIWVILFGVALADESAKIATEGVDLEQSKAVVLPYKNLKKSLFNWAHVAPGLDSCHCMAFFVTAK